MPACAERLAYLTGFTGSAGFAVVLEDKAALFVDGRYTVQARQQVDALAFEPIALAATAPEAWLENHAPKHARIGYDPWLHTKAQIDRFEKAAAACRGRVLMPLERQSDRRDLAQPPSRAEKAPFSFTPLASPARTPRRN